MDALSLGVDFVLVKEEMRRMKFARKDLIIVLPQMGSLCILQNARKLKGLIMMLWLTL